MYVTHGLPKSHHRVPGCHVQLLQVATIPLGPSTVKFHPGMKAGKIPSPHFSAKKGQLFPSSRLELNQLPSPLEGEAAVLKGG